MNGVDMALWHRVVRSAFPAGLLLTIVASLGCSSSMPGSPAPQPPQPPPAPLVNVTTWHNDNGRTGQNTSESVLTTGASGNVNTSTFGLICKIAVTGQIYGQPLVLGSTVYVVTMQDYVYAINLPAKLTSSNCPTPVAVNLLQATSPQEYPADCCFLGARQCEILGPTVGILGTPAIDTASNTLYVVTESQVGSTPTPGQNCKNKQTQPPSAWVHRLHALDLTTGTTFLAEKSNGPAVIPSAVMGSVTFLSQNQIQRPGLLFLSSGPGSHPTVYAAFSMMDGAPSPHPPGWVFGYDAQNLAASGYPMFYATTSDSGSEGGGIWQGGAGLAYGADGNGNNYLYFNTADGTFNMGTGPDVGDTFVKLTPDLKTVAGYFTPSDQYFRACLSSDEDFGSTGPILIPDNFLPSPFSFLAVSADKSGNMWVMDRGNPGGYNGGSCTDSCTQACTATDNNLQTIQASSQVFHNSAAFWNSHLYLAADGDTLKRYPISSTCKPGPVCPAAATSNDGSGNLINMGFGVTPSISSDASNGNGIVWTITAQNVSAGGNPAVLSAFDAGTLNELYDSGQCKNSSGTVLDAPGPATKFSVPTVANGYIFVGTQTDLDIYGPIPSRTCS